MCAHLLRWYYNMVCREAVSGQWRGDLLSSKIGRLQNVQPFRGVSGEEIGVRASSSCPALRRMQFSRGRGAAINVLLLAHPAVL